MKKTLIALSLAAATLSGCSITSSVMRGPDDTYIVSNTGGGFSSVSGLMDELYEIAQKHCGQEGKMPEVVQQGGNQGSMSFSPGSYSSSGGFYGGLSSGMGRISGVSYPEARLIFRCVDPNKNK